MSVFINACIIKERVGDCCDSTKFEARCNKYREGAENVVCLDNDVKNEPFDGCYVYEGTPCSVDISYSTYWDMIQVLYRIREEVEDMSAYDYALTYSSIDSCVGYVIAQEMANELTKYEEFAEKFMKQYFDEEYGALIMDCYKKYIEVLNKCVEVKGIVYYH
jgi:hypothetical protein